MNLSDEIRKQIEKNKALKLAVGEINNHLSILENLVRKDIMEQVDEAYQRGLEDGKAVNDKGCEGCMYQDNTIEHHPCGVCCNAYHNQWTAKDKYSDIIRNGIHNWVTELNVKLEDIASILEDMRHD